MVTARCQEDISIDIPEGRETAYGGLMSFEFSHFLALQGVDVDGGVFGASGDVLVVEEVDTQDGVTMVCLDSLHTR